MGVLAPLYLAGLAALSLPLIFHLVRRTPRGRQEFSSLMFLVPSPPRLTRRSRLDQIVLLLLRLAALALLAFAFARPFLREAATLALEDLPARRVAIMLDHSASMRRGDLWQQASAFVEKELAELGPHDEVALYTFGDRLQTEVGFDSVSADASASRPEIVRIAAKKLRPTWQGTDLGSALVAVASELAAASDVMQFSGEPRVIVIGDFQKGSRLDALQGFEWPKGVHVITRQVTPKRLTNVTAQLLTSDEETADTAPRVRVTSAADSRDDQFFVNWTSGTPKTNDVNQTAVYVPPGQSRVVKLPRPEVQLEADRIAVRGDEHDFDNTFFVVPPRKQEVKLVYAGSDEADDQAGPQFYLRLATSGDPLRQVELQLLENDDDASLDAQPPPQIAVVTRKVSASLAASLKAYAERGGTLLLAPPAQDAAMVIPTVLDDVELAPSKANEAADYLLLGEIDFSHPLFSPFANPRYNDFTKIHFWQTRSLVLKADAATKAIAKFDSGQPAILDRSLGKGRVYVFASGWHPEESQLALSSKFVPLIGALLDQACGSTAPLASVVVGQPVELPVSKAESPVLVHKPDGSESTLGAATKSFTETDQPGIYAIGSGAGEQRFSVNLSPAESNTAPLELEQLEQLGVKVGAVLTRAQQLDRIRQQRDTELESRQKIWRWLIIGVLGLLIFETAWAGRAARQIAKEEVSG